MLRLLPLTVAAAVGCAGCSFLFPDDQEVPENVRAVLADMGTGIGCEVLVEDARLLAVAADPGADADHQWWVAPTAGGGEVEIVVLGEAGGGGGSGGCEPPPDRGELWWSGGSGSESRVVHGGHAPEGASEVRLTFGEHEPVITTVQEDGYFLVAIDESACCEWSFPDRLEALDPDGDVIASVRP